MTRVCGQVCQVPPFGSVGHGGCDWSDLDAEVEREGGYWKLLPSTAR